MWLLTIIFIFLKFVTNLRFKPYKEYNKIKMMVEMRLRIALLVCNWNTEMWTLIGGVILITFEVSLGASAYQRIT